MNAEPFGSSPQPVPLDVTALPHGLTSLELRNVDITTPPAALAAAAAPAASCVTELSDMQQQQQEGPALSMQDGFAATSSSDGGGGGRGDTGAGSSCSQRGVLQQLESFKLESCRLRTAQLQVCGCHGSPGVVDVCQHNI